MKIRNQIVFALMLLTAVLLCACTAGGADAGETDTIDASVTVTYEVTVTDKNGVPLEGVMVQLCRDVCVPGVTDAEGRATFTLEKADYKVALITVPEGYTYASEVTEFFFAPGETEMTLILKKAG